ncbi:MAG TPA: hypothetical protein VGF75_00300 [Candidatus Saccharimonadales bacterium]|jgi:phage I-like protein
MAWFDRNNTNGDAGGTPKDVVLTDEHFERIATEVAKKLEKPMADSLATASQAALDANPVLRRLKDNMDAGQAEKDRLAREKAAATSSAGNKEFTDSYEALDDDTKRVIDTRFNQVNQTAMRAEARETRRSVFEDIENFPYYTGDLKQKIDEMIEKEPLTNQVNPLMARNCYKIVVADHIKDIQDGKVRSRLSAATGSSTSTTTTTDVNALPTLTDDEKKTAKGMGIPEAEWAKAKKDLIGEGTIGV